MRKLESTEQHYHDVTKHSYRSVLIDPNYVDASTQPTPFKQYPRFYRRFKLEADNPTHELIRLTSAITFNKHYKDGPYQLRVNPSAGALYPTEIYVQLRGIRGTIDGIYHLEVATESLTLIYELIDDGVESYIVPDRIVKGIIFLVSCVYYRSSWKYRDRSIRYCFLDSGHHIGAIEASAYLHHQPIQALFDFDKAELNQALGFENKEFLTACVIAGEFKQKSVRKLRSQLPFVAGTDYFEPNLFVEAAYQATLLPSSPKQVVVSPQFEFKSERFLQAILNRRSARRFKKTAISKADFLAILQLLAQPIPTESAEDLAIYIVVNRVDGIESGLYKNTQQLQVGDFSDKAGYLCINQAIARDSAITVFWTAHYTNYQTATQLAGWVGQRLYLLSDYLGLGCSGIGAFYDDETQTFLETDRAVLYALAIGL